MKNESMLVVILGVFALVAAFLFSKKTTPLATTRTVLTSPQASSTTLALGAAGSLTSSIAALFGSNHAATIDASAGNSQYVPNSPPLAAGLAPDQNFTPSTYTGPSYGPGVDTVNIIDSAAPSTNSVDSFDF